MNDIATTAPEAAAPAHAHSLPLLKVATVVEYHLRPGERRGGRTSVPAFVMAQRPEDGALTLLLFFDAGDWFVQDRAMPWTEGNAGWVYNEPGAADLELRERFENLCIEMSEAIFGKHDKPALSVEDRLRALEKEVLELKAKPAAKRNGK